MSVAPVRAEDDIALPEVSAHADGNRLFADIRMAGPMDKPPLVGAGKLLFALANDLHFMKQIEQSLLADAR
jgi:hypothetical protein